jgi:hypothetical protein
MSVGISVQHGLWFNVILIQRFLRISLTVKMGGLIGAVVRPFRVARRGQKQKKPHARKQSGWYKKNNVIIINKNNKF